MGPVRVSAAVFLLDIDNTLIDHDELKRRVTIWIESQAPAPGPEAFWDIYEAVREELGIVDFLECAARYGQLGGNAAVGAALRAFLWDFPFEELLLPGTLAGCEVLAALGRLAVLCDGHEPFQRRKLERIGLLPRLAEVFVFEHKEEHVGDVLQRFPDSRFILFDDKPRILRAMKAQLGEGITTVLVRHGHYAAGDAGDAHGADYSIGSLGAVTTLDLG